MAHSSKEKEESYQIEKSKELINQQKKMDDLVSNIQMETQETLNTMSREHVSIMETKEKEFTVKYETLVNKFNAEIKAHRESSKNADLALSRLRETLDRERDIQVTSLTNDISSLERNYKTKLHKEIERHQNLHNTLRINISNLNETISELEAKIRLCDREKSSALRQKDDELMRALEKSRIEHQDSHAQIVTHYETTISDMQATLLITRNKLNQLETKHTMDVHNVVNNRNQIADEIAIDSESRYSILEQGLEIEAQKANQARISEQRSKSELHEKNRELDEIDFAHNTAIKEMKKEFQHQMQTMRIEIINQHSRELAAERSRAIELEEKLTSDRNKYHTLADECTRKEEKIKMDSILIREEKEKSYKYQMQMKTLITLRDDLRNTISEMEVQLSSHQLKTQTSQTQNHHQNELLQKEIKDIKQQLEQETKKQREKETHQSSSKEEDMSQTHVPNVESLSSLIDGSAGKSSKEPPSFVLKNQLKATLTECSVLRTEVQSLKMSIHEKDFRLQALREIVGGLERMVPPERLL